MELTIERIKEIAQQKKQSLQLEVNQGMRKKDWEQGWGALASMEAVDDLVYSLELAAGRPYRNPADWTGAKARRANLRVLRGSRK